MDSRIRIMYAVQIKLLPRSNKMHIRMDGSMRRLSEYHLLPSEPLIATEGDRNHRSSPHEAELENGCPPNRLMFGSAAEPGDLSISEGAHEQTDTTTFRQDSDWCSSDSRKC